LTFERETVNAPSATFVRIQTEAAMNEAHLNYLASDDWAARLEAGLVPWITRRAKLAKDVLEIGPGPGLTTDILLRLGAKVTAVELDEVLAAKLAQRMRGRDVEVVHGDASAMHFATNRFSAVTAFSVMHHVPSAALQDRIFAEAYRVLAPGGGFFAMDPRDSEPLREFHIDDTFVPMPPETIASRLERVGFVDVELELAEIEFRFAAYKRA
jgi:SAM-dependent methyltransferase